MAEPDLAKYAKAALDGRITRRDYYDLWQAVMDERAKAAPAPPPTQPQRRASGVHTGKGGRDDD